jgi:hypothetical protein
MKWAGTCLAGVSCSLEVNQGKPSPAPPIARCRGAGPHGTLAAPPRTCSRPHPHPSTQVGARPRDVSIITYLQRLKEQGWDVTATKRKLAMCAGEDGRAILGGFDRGLTRV